MAEKHIIQNKRFVYRSPDKKSKTYVIPQNQTKIIQPPREPSPRTIIDPDTIDVKATPPRRVVVVRNPKNPQVKQKPFDLGDFERSNTMQIPPVATNGNRSIYFIRRPVTSDEPPKSTD